MDQSRPEHAKWTTAPSPRRPNPSATACERQKSTTTFPRQCKVQRQEQDQKQKQHTPRIQGTYRLLLFGEACGNPSEEQEGRISADFFADCVSLAYCRMSRDRFVSPGKWDFASVKVSSTHSPLNTTVFMPGAALNPFCMCVNRQRIEDFADNGPSTLILIFDFRLLDDIDFCCCFCLDL